jgi:hypothetical protein
VAAEQIEVYPGKDGWRFRKRAADGSAGKGSRAFEDRAACLVDAREAAGVKRETIFREDGSEYGQVVERDLRVVLLRPDGSEYGEIEPAASSATGAPQVVNITPVESTDEARPVS